MNSDAKPNAEAVPKPRRRWFRFSLRTLLIVVTLLSFACGWMGWKVNRIRARQRVVQAIEEAGGNVSYAHSVAQGGDGMIPGPAWLRRLLGENAFAEIHSVEFGSGAEADIWLGRLTPLTSAQYLDLHNTQITDAGLVHLEGMTDLRILNLGGTRITDAGLEHLKGLTNLERLQLSNTPITDAGLKHLADLTNLNLLILGGTRITDAGLEYLVTVHGLV